MPALKMKRIAGHNFATLGGFGAILLWSSTIACVRRLSEDVGPITAGAAVYSISALIAGTVLLRAPQRWRAIWQLPGKYLVGASALFAGYTLLLYLAIGHAHSRDQVLEVGLLNYLWPSLTLVLSLVILGAAANWVLIPGTLLALTGVFLVMTQGAHVSWTSLTHNAANNPIVYLLAASAAVCWALYSNLARKWAGGCQEGAVSIFLPVTALLLLAISCGVNEPRHWTLRAGAELLFQGIATYVSASLLDHAMRHGNVTAVAAASYFTPLLSTLISCFYLAVLPGPKLLIGCVVLITGSVLSWYSVNSANRQPLDHEPQPVAAADTIEST